MSRKPQHIYQEEDVENRPLNGRVKRGEPNILKPRTNFVGATQVQKRVALGQISTNSLRIQPTRNAKQFVPAVQDAENQVQGGTYSRKQTFKIHVDEDENFENRLNRVNAEKNQEAACVYATTETEQRLVLNPGVTNLNLHEPFINLTDNFCKDQGSPSQFDVTFESDDGREESTESDTLNKVTNVSDYSDDIFKNLCEAEKRLRINATYMRKQPDITPEMRSILIDWLVEVAEEFELHTETLYLTVAYIDKFLSVMSVMRNKLQLVGTTCMFIASKYEEIYPRGVRDFAYITDNTYSEQQVLLMEQLIYKVLSFELNIPTTNCFLCWYAAVSEVEKKIEHLATYMAELTLLEPEPYLMYRPSQIAASALILASHTLGISDMWKSKNMIEKSGYSVNGLSTIIESLYKTHKNAPSLAQQAIKEKYRSLSYSQASIFLSRKCLPCD